MSAFRSLAPSNQQDDLSETPPQIPNESSGGGTSGSRDNGSGSGGEGSKNRKKRTAGSVSLMACTPCRTARQRVRRRRSIPINNFF